MRMDAITTSCISSDDDFLSLEPCWNTLLKQSSFNNWFLTWEWLHTWWEIYASDSCKLYIIVTRKGANTIGIAPFYIQTRKTSGLTVRRLSFLGTQEDEAEEVCSMYMDILVAEQDRELVAKQIAKQFAKDCGKWDEAVFSDLLEENFLLTEIFKELDGSPCNIVKYNDGVRFMIDLPSTWDDYLYGISKHKRKEIRQNTKRLNAEGEIKEIIVNDPQQLDWAYDEMVRLHSHRWRKKGLAGAFSGKLYNRFHRKLLPVLYKNGWLDLRFIALDGKNISVLYNFNYDDTVYSYQSGFDYDKHSPGCLSDVMAIQQFIEKKYKHYDFLNGAIGSYKGSLCSNTTPMYGMIVYPNTAKGFYLFILETVKKSSRKILSKLR